jgi:probable HAF family extracellular repeat protein
VTVGATSLSDGQAVVWQQSSATVLSDQGGEAMDVNAAGYVVGWMNVDGARHGFVWHETGGLYDLGPGTAWNIDELGNVAGNRGLTYSETRATVWHVDMTVGEYLLGFRTLAKRLLGELNEADANRITRAIESAEHALARSNDKVARRHLERALAIILRSAQSGELRSERASALLTAGRWIAGRF